MSALAGRARGPRFASGVCWRRTLLAAVVAGLVTPCEAPSQTTSRRSFETVDDSEVTLDDCGFRIRADLASSEQADGYRVEPCDVVAADIVWPPQDSWNQSFDNLRFQADITNYTGTESATMLIYADDLLVGAQVVSTPAPEHEGVLHTRTLWPFPGEAEVSLRYLTPGGPVDAAGNSSLEDQSLHPDVKVHNLRFWNLSDPSGQTNVPIGTAQQVVDLLTPPIPDVNSDTLDGIYAQCPATTKTQWRYQGLGTLNLSNSCADMAALMCPPGCGGMNPPAACATCNCTPQACISEIWNTISNDPDNVHVVFVDTLGCGWSGAHWGGPPGQYLIVITDDSTTTADFHTELLAHELGHVYIGGHPTPPCPGSLCCGNMGQENRQLMCANVGRIMTNSDCTAAQSSNAYPDAN